MSTARWARKRSTRVGDHGVFEVWQHHYERDGRPTARPLHTLQTVDWCNVVPITTDDRIVLVRLHRFGTDSPSIEIPGGLVDAGESPIVAAGRELTEETGYHAGELISLGAVFANPALQPTRLHMHLARGCTPHPSGQSLDDLEDCEPMPVTRSELERLLDDGEITHALVWATLFAWKRYEAGVWS